MELGERGGMKTIEAKVPLGTMFQYVSDLRSMSKGRAQYSMVFDGYELVPPNVEKEVAAGRKIKGGEEDEAELDPADNAFSTFPLPLFGGLAAGSAIMLLLLRFQKSSANADDFR